jgi:hypothetical protein
MATLIVQTCAHRLSLGTSSFMSHMQELKAKGIPRAALQKDVFDKPGIATSTFISPFALGCDPLVWRELQEAFENAKKGGALSDEEALLQLGLPGLGAAVVQLTEPQLAEVHVLMGVLEETLDFSTVSWILGNCLVRAARANARVPQPQ